MSSRSPRQTSRLESAWRFHKGDILSPVPNTHIAAYMANKAGWARGAAKPDYDDSDWPTLNLPHDWSVQGPFDQSNHVANGYLPRGIAWYRRHFALDESDRGKYLALQFDGIAGHCTVYVNGHLLHRHFCGYTPFTIDISDIANYGDQTNVVAIRVDATPMEGWWYEGAGIYRHVWLIKTSPVHIAPDSVFIRPIRRADGTWITQLQATIINSSDADFTGALCWKILEPARALGAMSSLQVPARSSIVVNDAFINTTSPQLWSLQNPNLYRIQTEVIAGRREVLDTVSTVYGYRTLRFDPDAGFFLNDQPIKLKGTANHQDHAGVGVAVPDSIHRFRIRRLIEMGSNAYRAAHNPPATELLDACDELGMLVWNENRTFGSSPQHLEQLKSMIRRDRNHPSVILWSLCNEEASQGTPIGAAIAKTMTAAVKELDDTRPVAAAVSGGILNDDCIGSVIEVMGINYQLPMLDAYHEKHPNTPIIAAETHCSLGTRGVYSTDPTRQIFASYDTEKAFWGTTARQAWREISARPFVAGLFAWTGFDYRGEPTPHQWPSINTHWGILDTCGFAKDLFFVHKAFFTTPFDNDIGIQPPPQSPGIAIPGSSHSQHHSHPFIHLFPHWNWPGMEWKQIRVVAATNCQEAELLLNGKSLGRKKADPIEMADWLVDYWPGTLQAIGYQDGKPVVQATIQTTGPASSLALEVFANEPISIPADGEFALPITVFAIDAEARPVPTANDPVTFSIDGPATIVGVGNGDPNSHQPDKATARSLFNGLAQVILQTTTTPGEIILTASSPGLQPAKLTLHSTAATPRPSIPPTPVRFLIRDWRMSPITQTRPDPNQTVSDQDMNSWERITPSPDGQKSWTQNKGFAIYRATFTPPKILQSTGGQILIRSILAATEFHLNGAQVNPANNTILFPATSDKLTLNILIRADSAPAGLTAPVELLALPT